MNTPTRTRASLGLATAVAFSVFCWICLYAAFADFAETGFEMVARQSAWHTAAGLTLVMLHALGLLLLFLLAGGAVAVMVSETMEHGGDRTVNGTSH